MEEVTEQHLGQPSFYPVPYEWSDGNHDAAGHCEKTGRYLECHGRILP